MLFQHTSIHGARGALFAQQLASNLGCEDHRDASMERDVYCMLSFLWTMGDALAVEGWDLDEEAATRTGDVPASLRKLMGDVG